MCDCRSFSQAKVFIYLVAPLAEAEAEWKENESKIPAGQAENLQFIQL